MALDKKLSRLRKKEGLSQAEVAEKLDVSRQAVSRWESGEAKPSTDNFQALCKLYHVSMDYLLNESEDELPAPAPATESRPKGDTQRKEKRWIRWLVIGVAVLVLLLVCVLFWYGSRQKEDGLDLHSIQGEDSTFSEEPDFYLNLQ